MFDSIPSHWPKDDNGATGQGAAARVATVSPRLVTTGRKNGQVKPYPVDEDTGERVTLVAARRDGVALVRHLAPSETSSPRVALIDALAFSLIPPDEQSYVWVIEQMAQFIEIGAVEQRRGLFGFRYSARFGDGAGMIACLRQYRKGRCTQSFTSAVRHQQSAVIE